jgi:predicted amidohydrolase
VVADGGEQPGYIIAEVDPAKVVEARSMVPALRHDRRFQGPDRAVVGLAAAGE